MEKITWEELVNKCYTHNNVNGVHNQFGDKKPLICGVCYKQSNFTQPYSEESRTYEFRSDNKYFIAGCGGRSIFADCLDKKDLGVRLDWYEWDVEYCYIEN